MAKNQLDEAVRVINQGQKFLVSTHGKPDGDALGSVLAAVRALRKMGKDVLVLSQDGVSEPYDFIPECETIVHSTSRRDFDVAIVCDVQLPMRADQAEEIVRSVPLQVFIDHHPTSECNGEALLGPGKVLVCDPTAAATGEIILDLIDALGVDVDEIIASQLMAAVVSDTGCFRFTNVTPRTFAIASRLTELGASAPETARLVYESRPFVSAKLLGRALNSLESDASGRIVWARITRDDFESLGAADEDTEGIVNFVRGIKGAELGILFRDLGDSIRVSLRSYGEADAAGIAAKFGGGGHRAAAGCTLETSLDEAVKMVVAEAVRWTGY